MADEIIARNPPLPELTEKAPHTPALTPWATPPDGSRWGIFVLYLVAAPAWPGNGLLHRATPWTGRARDIEYVERGLVRRCRNPEGAITDD
jgi:hypothetical protein